LDTKVRLSRGRKMGTFTVLLRSGKHYCVHYYPHGNNSRTWLVDAIYTGVSDDQRYVMFDLPNGSQRRVYTDRLIDVVLIPSSIPTNIDRQELLDRVRSHAVNRRESHGSA
jgi:hypothetical protein